VECQNENEALEACNAGADIVMLDNMSPEDLDIASTNIKAVFPHIIIEASGVWACYALYNVMTCTTMYIYIHMYIVS
jgi:nicotinate-nucleotide pyrophosphorylase